jgi:hypothetical protein
MAKIFLALVLIALIVATSAAAIGAADEKINR